HRAFGVAGLAGGGFVEPRGGALDTAGATDQRLTRGGQSVAGLAPVEQRQLHRLLKRRDAPRDGGLADAQVAGGLQCAAVVGNAEEVTEVVPVEHAITPALAEAPAHSAIMQNNNATSLLP